MYYLDFNDISKQQYGVILADPPWTYIDKALAGSRGAGCKYPLMTLEELTELPVRSIAAKDAALFMWVTMPQLEVGLELIRRWGFTFKTNAFTWIKHNRLKPTLFWGMGRWTRSNAELCLLATLGHPRRVSAGVHSVVMSAVEGHSQKPLEVNNRIEQLMGDVPRIELFARRTYENWDQFGNVAQGALEMPQMPAVGQI